MAGSNSWLDKRHNLRRRKNVIEFNLNQDFFVRDVDRADGSYFKINRQISEFLIRNGIAAKYKDGIKARAEQRLAGKINNALAKALADGSDQVEFTLEQVQWFHDVLADWSVPPGLAGWHIELFDYVVGLIHDAEAEAKAAKNGTSKAGEVSKPEFAKS